MASIISAGTTSATALNMSADTSGVLQLASNNGTVAVTVDTSQNVGIGGVPSERLALINSTGRVSIFLASGGTNQGYISYFNATQLLSFGMGSPTGTGTNGGQQLNINANGDVMMGYTSPSYNAKLSVNGGIFTNAFQLNITSTNSSTPFEYVLRTGTAMNFYVSNATVLATLSASGVWTNASDARYKENIRPVSYGLAEVMQLQPRAYNIIGSEKQEIGFVAQEVEPLLPELVESTNNSVTNEDRFTLSYGQMSAVLVKAIQELNAKVTALENK